MTSKSILAGAVALVALSCSPSTKVSATWKDPNYSAGPVRSVLVIGARMAPPNRTAVEDELTNGLARRGILATPSHVLFPNVLPDRDQTMQAVQQQGFDGVLISRVVDVRDEVTYVPTVGLWNGFGYWGDGAIGYPDAARSDEFASVETSLWETRGESRLVWKATTKTKNPKTDTRFAHSLEKKVVPAMAKEGLLEERAEPANE